MAKKTATVVEDEVEELEEEEVELEEEAPAKATKGKAADAADAPFGVRALIALIKEKTNKEYKPREVRTLLRKLAREDGTIDREIVPGNKERYVWTGPTDPEVKAVLKAVKGGEIEAAKKAALDKLKADKAAKDAAKAKAAKVAEKKAAAAAAAADDEDED